MGINPYPLKHQVLIYFPVSVARTSGLHVRSLNWTLCKSMPFEEKVSGNILYNFANAGVKQ